MFPGWNQLPDDLQIALSQEALHRAAVIAAAQAEVLAGEIENGSLADRGGAEALRLFAAMLRASDRDGLTPQGTAEAVIPWQGLGEPSAGK
jgi:hypothetical protein